MKNYNVLAYAIYLPISVYITYWVGRELHRKGRVLMAVAFHKHNYDEWLDPINNSLLVGYYLLNIGTVFLAITQWKQINNLLEVLESVSIYIGFIVTLLGIIHAVNITVLSILLFKKPYTIPP